MFANFFRPEHGLHCIRNSYAKYVRDRIFTELNTLFFSSCYSYLTSARDCSGKCCVCCQRSG